MSDTTSRSLTQLALMLRDDQRRRWQDGQRPLVETYLTDHPQLHGNPEAVLDLVYNEYLLREKAGEQPSLEEYQKRFPDCAAVLQRQIELHNALQANVTTVAHGNEDSQQLPSSGSLPEGGRVLDGQTLSAQFGRYRILKKLGQGGMGTVYQAHDTTLDRQVALKVIQFREQGSDSALQRFLREARAAAALAHPHLCPVYDAGEIDAVAYLTMKYVEGRSLSDWIKEEGPLEERTAARLIALAARAMQSAHDAGVIHRDLKPSNIIVNANQEPIVIDFGLAQRLTAAEIKLTPAGGVIGTPAYLAPEQVDSTVGAVGPRTDVYSLGVALYEVLAGEPPFQGSVYEVLNKVVKQEPPPLKAVPALVSICQKAMSKQPEQRFADMAEFAAALEGFLQHPGKPIAVAPSDGARSPKRRHLGRWVAAAFVVAVLAGVILWVGFGGQNQPAEHTGPNEPTQSTKSTNLAPSPSDMLQQGSAWSGMFEFRPPITRYISDVQVRVLTRDGERFTAIYTTENKQYEWHIAGTIREGAIQADFTKAIREGGTPLVGKARLSGQCKGEEMTLVFTHPDNKSTADMKLRRVSGDK
jgi:serine/threonine-protein kinase